MIGVLRFTTLLLWWSSPRALYRNAGKLITGVYFQPKHTTISFASSCTMVHMYAAAADPTGVDLRYWTTGNSWTICLLLCKLSFCGAGSLAPAQPALPFDCHGLRLNFRMYIEWPTSRNDNRNFQSMSENSIDLFPGGSFYNQTSGSAAFYPKDPWKAFTVRSQDATRHEHGATWSFDITMAKLEIVVA